ncbi:MAG: DUF559 domain-containing protein [Litorimonas sp.]
MKDHRPHYLASAKTLSRSRSLRKSMTDEEHRLWEELRQFRSSGYAFRKQAAIGPYIADFLCRKAMLIVEVDGRHHDDPKQIEHDMARDKWLSARGYVVLRYAARKIWDDLEGIVSGIEAALNDIAGASFAEVVEAPSDLRCAPATSPIEGEGK